MIRRVVTVGFTGACIVMLAGFSVGGCGKKAEPPPAASDGELSDGLEPAADDDLEANEPEEESPEYLEDLGEGDELGQDDEGATE